MYLSALLSSNACSQHLLELGIFPAQPPVLPHQRYVAAGVLLAPAIAGLLAETMPARQFGHRHPLSACLRIDCLFSRKLTVFHAFAPFLDASDSTWLVFQFLGDRSAGAWQTDSRIPECKTPETRPYRRDWPIMAVPAVSGPGRGGACGLVSEQKLIEQRNRERDDSVPGAVDYPFFHQARPHRSKFRLPPLHGRRHVS